MKILHHLLHIFIPRESNNHKAKILHSSSLIVIASFFIALQGLINYLPNINPSILGYAASISREEVVRLTNQKRAEAGLGQLALNGTLSNAAQAKGNDMIAKDYWAHVAPDGTQPWAFFSSAGYRYRYAGENLARDFSNASSAVDAWMNSPTHRDNILNPKYKEIGIGVVEGDLAGSDTTVIVQFFGAGYADKAPEPLAQGVKVEAKVNTQTTKPAVVATPVPTVAPTITPSPEPVVLPTTEANLTASTGQQVLISPFTTTRTLSLTVVGLLLVVFIVDAFLVSKRRITRVAGRTFAHVVFLAMILSIILILKAGKIL